MPLRGITPPSALASAVGGEVQALRCALGSTPRPWRVAALHACPVQPTAVMAASRARLCLDKLRRYFPCIESCLKPGTQNPGWRDPGRREMSFKRTCEPEKKRFPRNFPRIFPRIFPGIFPRIFPGIFPGKFPSTRAAHWLHPATRARAWPPFSVLTRGPETLGPKPDTPHRSAMACRSSCRPHSSPTASPAGSNAGG